MGRVQCNSRRCELSGRIASAEPEVGSVEAAARAPLPLFSDGQELLIRPGQLGSAAPEERAALLQLLTAMVEELAS